LAITIYSSRVAYEPGIARPQLLLLLVVVAGVVVVLRLVSARLYSWIDRHFFREAVNTEHVLAELSEKVRTIVEAEPLLRTVTETVSSALHVSRVAALVRRNGRFVPAHALGYGPSAVTVSFPADDTFTERLRRQPLRANAPNEQMAGNPDASGVFKALGAELLLPLAANDRLLGFLSLGPKRSEAPYSPSDIRPPRAHCTRARNRTRRPAALISAAGSVD
jgi:sigma-B regulation protein RsbU (phosphoserine phosphatase)